MDIKQQRFETTGNVKTIRSINIRYKLVLYQFQIPTIGSLKVALYSPVVTATRFHATKKKEKKKEWSRNP